MSDDIVLGAKQFPNPKNITPKLDTDKPDITNTHMKGDISNAAGPGVDQDKLGTYNPPVSNIVPHGTHPVEHLFAKPTEVRHQLGHQIPRKHFSVPISEN
jgi:hypothetical protein